jgi:hypothetical protein
MSIDSGPIAVTEPSSTTSSRALAGPAFRTSSGTAGPYL